MKKIIFPALFISTLFLSAFTTYNSMQWQIAEGYSVKFTSKNPEGIFTDMKGDIIFDAKDLAASSVNMTIDPKSINTGNGMKNKHAKSEKWFDTENYPEIKFNSKQINKTDSGYEVVGTATIRKVTKDITIPFTFENNIFVGIFVFNRIEFELGPTTGMQGKKAEHEIQIEINVPVIKK